jgi:hypothetical protein
LTGRAIKGTWGNLGRQKEKEMIIHKWILDDGSELVPTTDGTINLTLPYLTLRKGQVAWYERVPNSLPPYPTPPPPPTPLFLFAGVELSDPPDLLPFQIDEWYHTTILAGENVDKESSKRGGIREVVGPAGGGSPPVLGRLWHPLAQYVLPYPIKEARLCQVS